MPSRRGPFDGQELIDGRGLADGQGQLIDSKESAMEGNKVEKAAVVRGTLAAG